MQTPPPMQPPDMYGPPPGPPARPSRTVPVVLLVLGVCMLGCCLVVPAVLYPVFLQARQAAQRRVTTSRVRQLAIACLVFNADYGGLPDFSDNDTFRLMLESRVGNERVFTDPTTRGPFQFNQALSHASVLSIRSASEAPMIYQTAPDRNGMRIVAFVDGHAGRIPEDTFQRELRAIQGVQYTLGPLVGKWSFTTEKGSGQTIEFTSRSRVSDADKVTLSSETGSSSGVVIFDAEDHLTTHFSGKPGALEGDVKWKSLDAFTLTTKGGTLGFKRESDPPQQAVSSR